MKEVGKYGGMVEFEDIGAGIFYLIDGERRFRLVFDYSNHELHKKLRNISQSLTCEQYRIVGTIEGTDFMADGAHETLLLRVQSVEDVSRC